MGESLAGVPAHAVQAGDDDGVHFGLALIEDPGDPFDPSLCPRGRVPETPASSITPTRVASITAAQLVIRAHCASRLMPVTSLLRNTLSWLAGLPVAGASCHAPTIR